MKGLYLLVAWFSLSAGVMLTSVAALQFYQLLPEFNWFAPPTLTQHPDQALALANANQPGQIQGVSTIMETADGRPQIVANFLQRYNSPLKPYDKYGQIFVDIADKYGIDFRLLPAIAMQESNLCKSIPEGTYNCLGFGIHERGTLAFESYEANFDRAARELKKNYIDKGLTTPQDIMRKYTPSSDGSWANSVNQWMAEMRYDNRTLGRQLKTNGHVLEFAETASSTSKTQ